MESKKQLKAQLTNEISKRFASRIKELEEKNRRLERLLAFERKTSFELADKVTELESELHQYQDWNERLQDFTDMSEEDRIEFLRNENNKCIDACLNHIQYVHQVQTFCNVLGIELEFKTWK